MKRSSEKSSIIKRIITTVCALVIITNAHTTGISSVLTVKALPGITDSIINGNTGNNNNNTSIISEPNINLPVGDTILGGNVSTGNNDGPRADSTNNSNTSNSGNSISGNTSSSASESNPLSSAESSTEENSDKKETLNADEKDITKGLNDSQKEAYAILTNKYMTEVDINAFKWNMIVSQFTIPYFNNIQDVLGTDIWKQMKDNDMDISNNPYIEALGNCLETLNANEVVTYLTSLVDGSVENFKFSDIYNALMEDGSVTYSPLYKDDGNVAYITDMFQDDALDDVIFFVKDKVAVTGNGMSSSTLTESFTEMNKQFLYQPSTKKQLAESITASSKVEDIEMPVWIQTDCTLMYNAIFINNAIRVGGFGTYEDLINSIGNSQLYIDRWGNICAYCRYGNDYRYVVVYPAYANPLLTSTEMEDDDFAGYGYYDFNNSEFWQNSSSPISNAWSNKVSGEMNDISGKNASVYTFNPDIVKKTYSDAKDFYGSSGEVTMEPDAYLGVKQKDGKASSYGSNLIYYNTTDNIHKSVGGVYSRSSNKFSNNELIPYIQIDTTNNFMINKAILSAYTRDSIGSRTDYYVNGHNWYDCMQDSQNTYADFGSLDKYDANNPAGLFSNSIVFDKYNVVGKVIAVNSSETSAVASSGKKILYSSATLDMDGNNHLMLNGTEGLHITDPSSTSSRVYTLFPSMLLHSYRKGLYSESPTLQSYKSGKWFMLQNWFADSITVPSMDMENTISISEDNMKGKYQPIEIIWNLMASDSDRYKTFVTFNYPSNLVPSNSVLYGMNRKLKEDGSERYNPMYYGDILSQNGSNIAGRKYVSIGLLDSTLDFTQGWGIWNTNLDVESYLTNSIVTGVRDRDYDSLNMYNSESFLSAKKVDNGYGTSYRYLLNDMRVSDVLENYPLEDVTLLSFIWLNYYLPQTPLYNKVNMIDCPSDSNSSAQNTNTIDQITDTTTTSAESSTDNSSTTSSDNPTGSFNTNNIYAGLTSDALYPKGIRITQSSVVEGENTTNTLLWTISQDKSIEESLTAGSGGGVGAGKVKSLVVSSEYINRVSFNYGSWVLAVNKNTQGDNLTHLMGELDNSEEYDTDDLIDRITFFLKHPIVAISNIVVGFFQMMHNNIACGNAGNMFSISWLIDTIISWGLIKWYLIISTIFMVVVFIIRISNFIMSKDKGTTTLLKEMGITIMVSTIPVLLLYSMNDVMNYMSSIALKDASNKVVSVEIESSVKETESLNMNFELAYQMYRDQYEILDGQYSDIAVPIPKGWDSYKNELVYANVSIKDLYNSVSYSERLTAALTESTLAEASGGTSTDSNTGNNLKDLYDKCSPEVEFMYYNYENFVPVSCDDYSVSVFYYFYDYIKYQYLKYWASVPDSEGSVFTAAAKNFSLPNAENDELWSSYASRMWDAERYMLLKSYNGIYNMYTDTDYVYSFNDKGQGSLNDLFGLGYLFNMTTSYNENYQGYVSPVYYTADHGQADPFGYWANTSRTLYENKVENYGDFCNNLKSGSNSYNRIIMENFYPLSYLYEGYTWHALVQNKDFALDPDSNEFENFCFSPTYLTQKFPDYYSMYPNYEDAKSSNDIINMSKADSLMLSNLNNRLYGRVYAAKGPLTKHDASGESSNLTPFERKLNKINNNIYKSVLKHINYLNGDIRDSSLIFNIALICTYEFDKEFSGGVFGTQIEPQHLQIETLDLDKFMRATYASNIDEIVKNRQVMYMIYMQDGGIYTAFIVFLNEIIISVVVILRSLLLIVMFVACGIICVSYSMQKPSSTAHLTFGILVQCIALLVGQLVMLLVTVLLMNGTAVLALPNAVIAHIALGCYIAVAIFTLKMFTVLIKDLKHFGGTVIVDSVKSAVTNIRNTIMESANNNVFNKKMVASNVNMYNMDKLLKSGGKNIRNEVIRKNNIDNFNRRINSLRDNLQDQTDDAINRKEELYNKIQNITHLRFKEDKINASRKYNISKMNKTYKISGSKTIDSEGNLNSNSKTNTVSEMKQLAKNNTKTNNIAKERKQNSRKEATFISTGKADQRTQTRYVLKTQARRNMKLNKEIKESNSKSSINKK